MTQLEQSYAAGLYALGQEEHITDELMQQLSVLEQALEQDAEYLELLSTPALSKEERCALLDQAFRDKVHIYVLNFMKILTEKGYIRHFSHCCDAYRDQYNRDHGILPVTAVTAVAMTADQQKRLTSKLEAITGKTVELHSRVDPSCLGGVRLDYDGKRVDDTVAHRLDAVRTLLKNTVL